MSIQQHHARQGCLGGRPEGFSIALLLSAGFHLAFILMLTTCSSLPTHSPAATASPIIKVTLVDLSSDTTNLPAPQNIEAFPSIKKLDQHNTSTEIISSLNENDEKTIITSGRFEKQDQTISEQASTKPSKKTISEQHSTKKLDDKKNTEPETEYGTPDRKPKPIDLQIPIAPSSLDAYADSTTLVASVNIDFEGKPLRVAIKQMADGSPALPKNFMEIIEKILLATRYKHAMKGGFPSDDIFVLEISIESGKITLPPELSIQLNSQTKDLTPTDPVMRRR